VWKGSELGAHGDLPSTRTNRVPMPDTSYVFLNARKSGAWHHWPRQVSPYWGMPNGSGLKPKPGLGRVSPALPLSSTGLRTNACRRRGLASAGDARAYAGAVPMI
jgi:hypothetical protein